MFVRKWVERLLRDAVERPTVGIQFGLQVVPYFEYMPQLLG